MNDRERWNRILHFESVDHVPDQEFGYWKDTLHVWHRQGLPKAITTNGLADQYFGFARRENAGVSLGLRPAFQPRILGWQGDEKLIRDKTGTTCLVRKDGKSTIPQYLDYPVKDRASWERFKERLNPHTPDRYPDDWEERKARWKDRDYPLGISAGSLFGWIRNWMGFETVSVMLYDDRQLIEDIMDHLVYLVTTTISRAVKEVDFDFASMWEDMAFRSGSMISPRLFKELMVPRYKQITGFLKQHGIDVVYIDCDGNINQLVGHWLEGGVNCMFPLEIRGGSDPCPIREKYGKQVLLMGGVDKTQLIDGKAATRAEINRLEKLVADGGFIPHVDHRVPPDVTLENYRYYLKVKREAFGIPEPEPVEVDEDLAKRRSV
ncbi:MAG: hypothetical protein HYY04_02620 [Chloroflexi bacterium]|nr:hypothetical protein [Chloroflexota bacterium]